MPEPLKDIYFNASFTNKLASAIREIYPAFAEKAFNELVFDSAWQEKELKARMRHITQSLRQTLPENYAASLAIINRVAPEFSDFNGMVFPDYVEVYGLNDWELSLEALVHLTKFSSSEFAIRPYILKDSQDVMKRMKVWAQDENHHVRRFTSEGCRPRLPWAMAIPEFKKDPSPILPILEMLKNDDSEYVRRSVANNVNDISKDHPELVLDMCEKWIGKNKHTNWIVKHACRGLLKNGHRRALALFNFPEPKHVEVAPLTLDKKQLAIGETLHFTTGLLSSVDALGKIRLEYAIDFTKANGKTSRKIFKITENDFAEKEKTFSRKHSFRDLSTRKHYAGTHKVALIVNGVEKGSADFELTG